MGTWPHLLFAQGDDHEARPWSQAHGVFSLEHHVPAQLFGFKQKTSNTSSLTPWKVRGLSEMGLP